MKPTATHKENAVLRLLLTQPELSNVRIARLVGLCSESFVRSMRKGLA
jgi:hypothetical protein